MTTAELHEILDDENCKLTADELKEVVYQLKQDCNDEYHKQIMMDDYGNAQFYSGERSRLVEKFIIDSIRFGKI